MPILIIQDPCVVVLIGAAGSGKSTVASRLFAPDEVLSSDAMREAIAGDASDQRATGPAFRAIGRSLERRLTAGRLTVIDATNLKARDRRPWLLAARRHGVAAVAIVLQLPAAIVHARNAGRDRVVDQSVVDRHLATAGAITEAGLVAEGFASVVVLRDPLAIDGLELVRAPVDRSPIPPAPPPGA